MGQLPQAIQPTLGNEVQQKVHSLYADDFNAVPLAPMPSGKPVAMPTPQLANPVGDQETNPNGNNAYFNGPLFPPGYGMASSPDVDARRKYVNDQIAQQNENQRRKIGIGPGLQLGNVPVRSNQGTAHPPKPQFNNIPRK